MTPSFVAIVPCMVPSVVCIVAIPAPFDVTVVPMLCRLVVIVPRDVLIVASESFNATIFASRFARGTLSAPTAVFT